MKKRINVLSLFDGMSCGRIALDRACIEVNTYYASEIDKYAIQVSNDNYPDIIRLGDVTKWKEWDIDWSTIDLLIGGSPCQGFSFAGKQLAFDDPRSVLFFEYVAILNHIKEVNPKVKFLLENVKMKKEYMNVISQMLQVQPMFINSSLLSAQNRQRYYWFNWFVSEPKDKGIALKDILEELPFRELKPFVFGYFGSVKRIDNLKTIKSEKANCCTTNSFHPTQYYLNESRTKMRNLSVLEYERLQTVPDNYTNYVSNTQRYRMIGNGWTVDVIAHIFMGLINKDVDKVLKLDL